MALPTEESARLALRTQQVLAYETGVGDTIDPLAGSYFVEDLTDRIEKAAFDYIQKIDEMGGSVRAIENGYMQQEIQKSAFDYQKAIEAKDLIIVGVNQFQVQEKLKPEILKVNEALGVKQKESLQALKKSRDNAAVKDSLAKLKKAAEGTDNLMPFILEAVKCYTTLGEISGALKDVFGEYHEQVFI